MVHFLKVNSVKQLLEILDILTFNKCNLISYIWREYGFLPTIFNDFYYDFYHDESVKTHTAPTTTIGLCFEGHEIFYEQKVDILITLEGFIDTSLAYVNNKETERFIKFIQSEKDRGVAFLKTILNFDYEKCEQAIRSNYEWNAIIYPSLFDGWTNGAVPYAKNSDFVYGHSGEKGKFLWGKNESVVKWFGWNMHNWIKSKETINLERTTDYDEYDVVICKNSWKTRNYHSFKIEDFLSTNKKGGSVGYVDNDFIVKIAYEYIKQQKNLVIVNDLIEFDFPNDILDSKFISIVNMYHYLDVRKLMSIANHATIVYVPGTAALDLVLYYCNVNVCVMNHHQFGINIKDKEQMMNKVQQYNNKWWKSIIY
jgi:hypothetical protein